MIVGRASIMNKFNREIYCVREITSSDKGAREPRYFSCHIF